MSTIELRDVKKSSRILVSRGMRTILVGLVVLYIASALIAPTSVSRIAQMGMLPFAAALAIVGLGQTLVIQQGGIDLSVAGAVSLTVVIVTWGPDRNDSRLIPAVAAAFCAAIIIGIINGVLITRTKLNSIVATLGTNAIAYGVMMGLSGGSPRRTTDRLANFTNSKIFGLPHSIWIGVIVTIIVTILLKRTVFGRRFEAVGANPRAARAAGLKVGRYQMSAYINAQILYCIAGVVLGGVISQPTAYQGDDYVLPSVAVVVLGGTSLLGGRGFPAASAVAALFLKQLDMFVLSLGVPYGVRTIVISITLMLGIAIYAVNWLPVRQKLLRWSAKRTPNPVSA
ncbi:MAG: ABC transporter permease [Candidatus Nanopelagicaceae bacterium]|nr:ABC transporter permease [Candidatus Nanopelagicaceae bacterium]